mgnify:CR=1 FL=1
MRKISFLLMVFFVLGLSFSFGQPPPPEGIKPPEKERGFNSREHRALKEIIAKFEEKRDDLFLKMQLKKLELVQLLKEEPPQKKKLQAKIDEIIELERDRQKLMIDEFFAVRKILKPQQAKHFTRRLIKLILREK